MYVENIKFFMMTKHKSLYSLILLANPTMSDLFSIIFITLGQMTLN